MNSCLYEGRVYHHRLVPRPHSVVVRLFQVYLDLDELDEVFAGRWFWSTRRWAPVRYRRSDFHGDPDRPLQEAVRDTIEEKTGERPRGPIRVLTHLRTWGYQFNPVSIYYAFEPDGETLHSVLAEITNTPWGERHAYALRSSDGQGAHGAFAKEFHVSPFFDLDQEYRWSLEAPGDGLLVHMENHEADRRVFDAGLELRRVPITRGSLARMLLRYPAMPALGHAIIYGHALRLWWKRTPFFVHPGKRNELGPQSPGTSR